MANKRERERREKENILVQKNKAKEKILPFYLVSAGIGLVAIRFYFFNWVYIFNTTRGVGVEVGCNGFNFLIATLTGKFSSTSKVYGDLAVPFYYYAAKYCKTLGVVTLISIVCLILSIGFSVAAYFTKKQELSIGSVVTSLGAVVLLIVCFTVALSMKDSDILPVYCSGNPRCSIESLAILPAIVVCGMLAVQCVAAIKYLKVVLDK